MELLCTFLPGILVSGFIGALIGSIKNQAGAGLLLGAIFGPCGWFFALLLSDNRTITIVQTPAQRPPLTSRVRSEIREASSSRSDTSGAIEIAVSARVLEWPQMCACCCGPADTSIEAASTRTTGVEVVRQESKSWNIPYCRRCITHVNLRNDGTIHNAERQADILLEPHQRSLQRAQSAKAANEWVGRNQLLIAVALALIAAVPLLSWAAFEAGKKKEVGKALAIAGGSIGVGSLAGICGWFGFPAFQFAAAWWNSRAQRIAIERRERWVSATKLLQRLQREAAESFTENCATRGWAVEYVGWNGHINTFRFCSEKFAAEFERLNERKLV